MARYIDAERMPNDSFWDGLTDKEKAKVLQWLLQSPTADVEEVKRGKWICEKVEKTLLETLLYERCSICGKRVVRTDKQPQVNYCCICGAKMDGGKTE